MVQGLLWVNEKFLEDYLQCLRNRFRFYTQTLIVDSRIDSTISNSDNGNIHQKRRQLRCYYVLFKTLSVLNWGNSLVDRLMFTHNRPITINGQLIQLSIFVSGRHTSPVTIACGRLLTWLLLMHIGATTDHHG